MIFQVILVQVFFFIGLVLVLRKILITSSYNETRRLQQLNEENSQKTQELASKISDAENEYRDKMAKADAEIRRLKEDSKKEVEQLKEAMIARGKAESDRIISQALNTRDEIRLEIKEQMKEDSITFSQRIFQKILGSAEQRSVHDGLLESLFQDLDKIKKDQLGAVDLEDGSNKKVEVKTPYPMSSAQKEKLETILSSKLEQKVAIQEVTEKEIIAGVVIRLDSFIIDGSLPERFRKAAEELK